MDKISLLVASVFISNHSTTSPLGGKFNFLTFTIHNSQSNSLSLFNTAFAKRWPASSLSGQITIFLFSKGNQSALITESAEPLVVASIPSFINLSAQNSPSQIHTIAFSC